MDGWMDGWIDDGWMDGWMDGWIDDGWMDASIHLSIQPLMDEKRNEVLMTNDELCLSFEKPC